MRGENNGRWMTWWCVNGKRSMSETLRSMNVSMVEHSTAVRIDAVDGYAVLYESPLSSERQLTYWGVV